MHPGHSTKFVKMHPGHSAKFVDVPTNSNLSTWVSMSQLVVRTTWTHTHFPKPSSWHTTRKPKVHDEIVKINTRRQLTLDLETLVAWSETLAAVFGWLASITWGVEVSWDSFCCKSARFVGKCLPLRTKPMPAWLNNAHAKANSSENNIIYVDSEFAAAFSTLPCLENDRLLPCTSDQAVTVFSGVWYGGVGPRLVVLVSLPGTLSCPHLKYRG